MHPDQPVTKGSSDGVDVLRLVLLDAGSAAISCLKFH